MHRNGLDVSSRGLDQDVEKSRSDVVGRYNDLNFGEKMRARDGDCISSHP
jgi:hypothetical protein